MRPLLPLNLSLNKILHYAVTSYSYISNYMYVTAAINSFLQLAKAEVLKKHTAIAIYTQLV